MVEKQIKGIRQELMGLTKFIEALPEHAEYKLKYAKLESITKVIEIRMWLGKILGLLGTPSPYKKGQDTSTAALEDFADKDTESFAEHFYTSPRTGSDNQIKFCKGARARLADILNVFKTAEEYNTFRMLKESQFVEQKFEEARMWLGMYMGYLADLLGTHDG